MKGYYVYIMAGKRNGTLYVGVTNNLPGRVYKHKHNVAKSFTKRYNVSKLVYYEKLDDINAAKDREKQVKKWNRQWKMRLIENFNPEWKDLCCDIIG